MSCQDSKKSYTLVGKFPRLMLDHNQSLTETEVRVPLRREAEDSESPLMDPIRKRLKRKEEKTQEKLAKIQQEKRKMKKEKILMTVELKALRKDKAALQKQLEDYKDIVLKHHPDNQVPDSKIAQAWEGLKENISEWIGLEILRFEKEYGRNNDQAPPKLFSDGGDPRIDRFLANDPQTRGEYLVRAQIHCMLQERVFNHKIVLFALKSEENAVLEKVQHWMATSSSPKGERWILNQKDSGLMKHCLRSQSDLGVALRSAEIHFDK